MKIPAKLKVTFWLGKEEYEDQWHRVLVASPTFVAESVSVDPIYFSFFVFYTNSLVDSAKCSGKELTESWAFIF